jgi:hypothetical protein
MQQKKEIYRLLKYGVGLALFVSAVLFVTEKCLSLMVSNSDQDQTGNVNLFMQHRIDPNILVLGSSVAEVGFNSNLISDKCGLSVYNGAIDGTKIIQSKFVIDEFLSYSSNCNYIVIGLAFFSFSEITSLTEPSRFLAHFSNKHVKENVRAISPELYTKLKFVPFYSFTQTKHSYYKNAVFGARNIIKGKKPVADNLNGFVPHHTEWNDSRITEDQFGTEIINISPGSVAAFTEIVKQIKASRITPILVITPMYINGQKFFKNYNDFLLTAKSIGAEAQVPVWDFSKSDIVLNEDFYYNNGHLNSKGADLFSAQVADSIKSFNLVHELH